MSFRHLSYELEWRLKSREVSRRSARDCLTDPFERPRPPRRRAWDEREES